MRVTRWILAATVSLFLVACDDDGGIGPSTTPSLTGTWSGMIGPPMSGTALRLTWQATQTGNNVTGPAILIKPANNVPVNGVLDGTLAGAELSLRYTAQGGTVTGFPTCVVSGTGSATLSGNSISGNLSTTFTSCAGTGLEPPATTQLSLTRQ